MAERKSEAATDSVMAVDPAAAKDHALAVSYRGRLMNLNFVQPAGSIPPPRPVLVVEGQYPGRNGTAVIQLARAAGHLTGILGYEPEEVVWLQPSHWKRVLCPGVKAPKPTRARDWHHYVVHQRLTELLDQGETMVYLDALTGTSDTKKPDLIDAAGILIAYLIEQGVR